MNCLSPCVALFVCSIGMLVAVKQVHAQEPAAAEVAHVHGPKLGELISPVSVAPFALLLLCIALFPLLNPHWWEHHRNKGIIVAVLGMNALGDGLKRALNHGGLSA